jgi:hypothetical protein
MTRFRIKKKPKMPRVLKINKKINYTISMSRHHICPFICHRGSKPKNLLMARGNLEFFL